MTLSAFERIVAEEADHIPEKFRKRLKNVVFVVEDEPSEEDLERFEVPEDETLLGMFDGPDLGAQGAGPWEFPGRIVIFRGPTEDEAAATGQSVREVVRDTVWHEVGHYLGMDEREVRQAEIRRGKEERKA